MRPICRGEVAFFGVVDKKGLFVGVRLDFPMGKNNGTVEGKRYFDALAKYGIFVAPTKVLIGDYPPESDNEDEI